ncbi:MAG: putative lipid II flippase FtsW [bacterium]|nr:putative lipid II flippase FtsW [bacterium]
MRQTASRSRRSHPQAVILFCLLALVGVGTLMIYSSSAIYAERIYGSPYHFLVRQVINLALGFAALALAMRVPYQKYRPLYPLLMFAAFFMMVVVLIPGIGTQIGAARRWIRFGGIGFQPSEFVKFALILWMASFLSRKQGEIRQFSRGLLPSLIVMGIFFFLLVLQPDFGTAVLISLTLFSMIFLAGLRPSHMFLSLSGLAAVGAFLIAGKSYRLRRVTGFLDPWADPLDTGFQLIQSFIAFGRGGIFGKDLGNSTQKLFFLPEAHTDFIFSILAEETGFLGVLFVVILVTTLMIKGYQVAQEAPDDFGRNLAVGITTLFALQSVLNMGVVIGLLPTKGIPLPFVSYGGTSLIMGMFMAGVLVNVARSLPDNDDA